MVKGEERLFIDDLKNLNLLKSSLIDKKKQLDKIEYKMAGVVGLDPTKEVSNGSGNERDVLIITLSPICDELKKEIMVLEGRISFVENVLSRMEPEYRCLVTDVYANGMSYEDAALMKGYSDKQLKRIVTKVIRRALAQ